MKKLIVIVITVLVIGTGFFLLSNEDKKSPDTQSTAEEPVSQDDTLFVFGQTEYDFGIIKQSGGKVAHDFLFTYNGKIPLEVTGVPTSCACTSAIISKTKLQPGDTATITVKFNPNLHAEPEGKFFKTVALMTDPKVENIPEIKIWIEIDLDLGPEAFELQSDHDDEGEEEEDGLTSYQSITPERLNGMLENKDFTLIDVHIPEQEHIEQTDLFIPYDKIEQNLAKLPKNKDEKIVLYCRSGGMSRAAAYTLAEEGYTNIYDLSGGKNAFDDFLMN